MKTELRHFDPSFRHEPGRSRFTRFVWALVRHFVFFGPVPLGNGVRLLALRVFGAQLGEGVVVRNRVSITFPWKLKIGAHSWLGDEVMIINLEFVTVGANVCVSQRAVLCTGNHDYKDPRFSYRNMPITIQDGAWIGACAFVSPGGVVAKEAVVTAGTLITANVPPGTIVSTRLDRREKPRYSVNR